MVEERAGFGAAPPGRSDVPPSPAGAPPRLSVVVPFLDEEGTLEELHARLSAVLEQVAPGSYEIVYVNDGSRDGSARVLEGVARDDPHSVYIELRRRFGKAAALAAGFREARGELVATLDADLQDRPEELPLLLERIEAGADCVTGRKRHRRDPWSRRLASRIFNLVVSLTSGARVRDVNSGLKMMRREVLRELPMHGELHRYLPVLAHARGFAIEEVDVAHDPRRFGRSRYGWSRYLAGLLDVATVMMLTRYERRPLHYFGSFGLLLFAAGGAILGYLGVGWFFGRWIGDRPLFSLGVLLVILGLQTVFFGLLAELIVLRDRRLDSDHQVRTVKRHAPGGGSDGNAPAS